MLDFGQLLRFLVERGASDLHVKVGSPPRVRIAGRLMATDFAPPSPAEIEQMAVSLLPAPRAAEFAQTGEADVAHGVPGVGRFRVNVYRQRGSVALAVRWVPPGVPVIDNLGLPPTARRLAEQNRGLVVVCGPAASGRTTTAAAMIDHINTHRACHIVTVEDPVEFLHPDKKGIVSQREVGTDTRSFREALRRTVRQDPDVIFVGELRDPDSVAAVLAAADTGKLVIAVVAATSASEAVQRLIEFFPPSQHRQIRSQLAASLRGVLSQRLLERADGSGRVPVAEILVHTPRVAELIANPDQPEGSLAQAIVEGQYYGMQSVDQHLAELCLAGLVDPREALGMASNADELRITLETAGVRIP